MQTFLPSGIATAHATAALPAIAAMVFGLFIVGMVGFSPLSALHNAAHDVRHSNGFPCH